MLLNLLILFYCIWTFYFSLESTSLGVAGLGLGLLFVRLNSETSFSFRQGGAGGAELSQSGWCLISSSLSSSTPSPCPRGPWRGQSPARVGRAAATWERKLPPSFCLSGRHRLAGGLSHRKTFPHPGCTYTHPCFLLIPVWWFHFSQSSDPFGI